MRGGTVLLLLLAFLILSTSTRRQKTTEYRTPVENSNSVTANPTPSVNPSKAGTIDVGSQTTIPHWSWVTVINKKPITHRFANGNFPLVAGDECGVEGGGRITVTEVRGDSLIVTYSSPGNPLGTPCPSGAQFVVSRDDFAAMSGQYAANCTAVQLVKGAVTQILAQNYYGDTVDAGEWHWVTVANIDTVESGNNSFTYGDFCGIGRVKQSDGHDLEGGTVRSRGSSCGRVLYEYTARAEAFGTAAPSGILFFQ